MRLGDSQTFKVEGPAENEYGYKYNWLLFPLHGVYSYGGGKQFTFTADPQKYRLSNRMRVTCELSQLMLVRVCQPHGGGPCWPGLDWVVKDEIAWDIRIVQDGPVWQG